ncbi:MAG: energy transducer TonB, partial [Pseudomonadales bacterium]|nr:energy transducer TonB [Pseudomonadales bacterium]
MKNITIALIILGVALTGSASAAEQEVEAASLDELLEMVREGKVVNRQVNERREREFLADKAKQQQELQRARRLQAEEEARSDRLETEFENNEQEIAGLQEILSKRLGSLRELFGVLQ